MIKRKKKLERKRKYLRKKRLKIRGIDESEENNGLELGEINFGDIKKFSRDERISIIRNAGEKVKKDLNQKIQDVLKWFQKHDPIYLLSYCAFYFLFSPKGEDPEIEGTMEIYPFNIEILQAMILTQTRNFDPKPLSDDFIKFKEDIIKLGNLIGLSFYDIPENFVSEESIRKWELILTIREQTLSTRNWGYPYQMERITKDLAKLIKVKFSNIFNIDPVRLMDTFFELIEKFEERRNDYLKKIKKLFTVDDYKGIINVYNEEFPDIKQIEGEEIKKLWFLSEKKIEKLRLLLIFHADLRLSEIFTFNLEEIVSIYGDISKRDSLKRIFDKLSFSFNDLNNYKIEHIFLTNPVHEKPFIKIENDKYFTSIIAIFYHISLKILETLISENEELKKSYHDKIKSNYLEAEVKKMVDKNFPSAKVYHNLIWTDLRTKIKYENDIVFLIGNFLVVFECKAGLVSLAAKRGAPDRLSRTLKELIEAPAEQAIRFINFLKTYKQKHKLRLKSGGKIELDSTKIDYYIPLGITLETLFFLSSNTEKIADAKIFIKNLGERCSSISLTDLECIFELLPFETQKVHYLERRREIETQMNYIADELDLLALYRKTGFNVGELEYKSDTLLCIPLMSKELDPFFNSKINKNNIEKPTSDMTKLWRDLLWLIKKKSITIG